MQEMRRKWGSCSSAGTITLARDLAAQDRRFQDYVIVHELLHLRLPTHGRVFKALGGQGRNRTTDTRIFSTTESPARREQADDPEEFSAPPTELARSTDPMPNRHRPCLVRAAELPCPSTACARRDRTFSEPKPPAPTASPRQLIVTARCEPRCCSAIVRSLTESRTKALAPSSIAREVPLLLSDRAALRRKTLRAPVRRHASDFQRAPERRRIAERGRVAFPRDDRRDGGVVWRLGAIARTQPQVRATHP